MKILITDGQNFLDRDGLFAELDRLHAERPSAVLIHGGAQGADRLGAEWAESRGVPVSACVRRIGGALVATRGWSTMPPGGENRTREVVPGQEP